MSTPHTRAGGSPPARSRRAATLLAAVALALASVAAGCGDDDNETTTSEPTATTTTDPTTTDTNTNTDTTTDTTTTDTDTNGSGGTSPGEDDTAKNDIPPKPGSPAEEFEEYCDQNPEACS
jgi:hypothetical protein